MSTKRQGLFWTSYSDLMTTLFVVMLLLFALSYALHTNQIENIKSIQESYEKVDSTYYVKDNINRRMIFREPVQFVLSSATIDPKYHATLYRAGSSLLDSIKAINSSDRISEIAKRVGLKYILIIEGSASRDIASDQHNYELSYRRALSVYNFWKERGIVFDPETVEVIIAGSGTGGIGRSVMNEKLNQRIIIQLMAKYDISKLNE